MFKIFYLIWNLKNCICRLLIKNNVCILIKFIDFNIIIFCELKKILLWFLRVKIYGFGDYYVIILFLW